MAGKRNQDWEPVVIPMWAAALFTFFVTMSSSINAGVFVAGLSGGENPWDWMTAVGALAAWVWVALVIRDHRAKRRRATS